ncbi:MAG: hypothetical protein ABSF28_06365 [Terracidiphilus sp.]|jgi:hypothetical protein
MPSRLFYLAIIFSLCSAVYAESPAQERYQVYGGYNYLSNSFNGVPGARQGLSGWDVAGEFPEYHGVRFVLDTFGYRGTNQGVPQHAMFIMAGAQFGRRFGREKAYLEGLAGNGNLNQDWAPGGVRGEVNAFSAVLGGGVDTPLTRHLAFRVAGGYQHTSFNAIGATTLIGYRIPGLPHSFARITSGLIWKF